MKEQMITGTIDERASGRTYRRVSSLFGLFVTGHTCLFFCHNPQWTMNLFLDNFIGLSCYGPIKVNVTARQVVGPRDGRMMFLKEVSSNLRGLGRNAFYSLDHDFEMKACDLPFFQQHWRIM